MTPEGIALVRESWHRLGSQKAGLAREFYRRLFELDPALRNMFPAAGLELQASAFSAKVTSLLAALDAPELLVTDLAALGRRHAGYGVTARHYDLLGEALLLTLRTGAAEEWSGELDEAWRDTYTLLSSLMQRAARRSSGGYHAVSDPA